MVSRAVLQRRYADDVYHCNFFCARQAHSHCNLFFVCQAEYRSQQNPSEDTNTSQQEQSYAHFIPPLAQYSFHAIQQEEQRFLRLARLAKEWRKAQVYFRWYLAAPLTVRILSALYQYTTCLDFAIDIGFCFQGVTDEVSGEQRTPTPRELLQTAVEAASLGAFN